ncbi:DUF397 domain-containing protein [Micromonospora sp. NBC_01813]|uniref:DUF397 domain-containing protein n=1 Tax=Micromonospora sp. NBC_01813 TaxID=2975988 RepID=UPI002DDA6658|nr:DUF397 domain-containing protein [Micromonospora sp. NBC_01813]WSA07061.1 DUF397 domain-containing protein [Micromonospora sp. NBC_01813]
MTGGVVVESSWRKSKASMAGDNNCVEVSSGTGRVLVRDSKDPDGCRLSFPTAGWASFVSSLKADISPRGAS